MEPKLLDEELEGLVDICSQNARVADTLVAIQNYRREETRKAAAIARVQDWIHHRELTGQLAPSGDTVAWLERFAQWQAGQS